jgi:hypothetical protein
MGGRGGSSGMRGSESALQALNRLQDISPGIDTFKKTPLAVDTKYKDLERETNLSDEGIKTVSISNLVTPQEYVQTNRIREFVHNPQSGEVRVVQVGNDMVLVDGNHRAVANQLMGKKTVRAHVYRRK